MSAPSPPPTIPSRIFAPVLASLRPSMAIDRLPSLQPECAADLFLVDYAAGVIVKRLLGDADDVAPDKVGAFARAVLRVLEGAFPLEHRPGRVAVLQIGRASCRERV